MSVGIATSDIKNLEKLPCLPVCLPGVSSSHCRLGARTQDVWPGLRAEREEQDLEEAGGLKLGADPNGRVILAVMLRSYCRDGPGEG